MGRSGVSNAFLQGFLNSYNRSSRENDPELLELKKLQIQDAIDRAKDRDEKAILDRVKTLADLSPFVDLPRETETVNPYGEYAAPIDYGGAQTYEAPTSFEKTIAEAYRSPFTRGDLGRNFKGVIEATPPDVLKRIGIVPPPEEFQTLSEGQTVIPKRALSIALSGIGIVPQAPTGGQTASEVQPPPSPAQTGPALTTIVGVPGLTVPKKEPKAERATVNGQIVEKGPDGVWKPVYGEAKKEKADDWEDWGYGQKRNKQTGEIRPVPVNPTAAGTTTKPPPGYRLTVDGNLEAIPGGPADIKATHEANQALQRMTSLDSDLDRLGEAAKNLKKHPGLGRITGAMGSLPNFPGSEAANAAAELENIKSQAGFNVLQNMREMSKTGGALGQVSDFENKMLQANLAALQTSQSTAQFKKNLDKIAAYAEGAKKRIKAAYGKHYGTGGTGTAPTNTTPPPSSKFTITGVK